MGGFILYHNDIPQQVLSTYTFTKLLNAGCIDFPSITEQDIKIKSSAHPLLAAITLLQATWFIIQCIARGTRGLDITLLEAITIVLIGIHAILFIAWWHKPLDPHSFVRIDAKTLPSSPDALRILHNEAALGGVHRDFVRQSHLDGNYWEILRTLEVPFERKQNIELSPSKFIPYASKMFTGYEQLFISLGCDIQRNALEVPMFHSPHKDQSIFVKIILGFLFASPYFAMWASHFPNSYHEKVWHVASIISLSFSGLFSLCCILFCLLVIVVFNFTCCLPHRGAAISFLRVARPWGCVGLVVSGARIALIIEALICLMSLSTARLAVTWTSFIPHVT